MMLAEEGNDAEPEVGTASEGIAVTEIDEAVGVGAVAGVGATAGVGEAAIVCATAGVCSATGVLSFFALADFASWQSSRKDFCMSERVKSFRKV